MGMDLTGKSGNYFRANVWSWRPILSLVQDLNATESLGLDLSGWEHNDGQGLHSQEECNKLATAIESRVNEGLKEVVVEAGGIRVDDNGRFLKEGETGGKSPYSTDADHLLQFATFLRESGGEFHIW